MSQTRYIHFRVSNEQYETIKNSANKKNYKTVAAYMRDLSIDTDPAIQTKIKLIYDAVMNMEKKLETICGEKCRTNQSGRKF